MKYQANGGYQILNFEGVDIESVSSLDYEIISNAIKRQKVLMVIGLVITTTILNCIANASLDETNEVVEIFIEDKKLTIANDDSVTLSDAVVPATKKLYCHPIELYSNGTYRFLVSGLIFNNDPTKYTTWTQIKNAIKAFGGTTYCRLMVTGGAYDADNTRTIITNELIYVVSTEKFLLLGCDTTGTLIAVGNGLDITNASVSIEDDVNEVYPNLA